MKFKFLSLNPFPLLAAFLLVSAFTLGCNSGKKKVDKAKKKLINKGKDLITEEQTIYYNSHSYFSGPLPKKKMSATTDTLTLGAQFSTSSNLNGDGSPLASAIDSITFVTKLHTNGGLNITEVQSTEYTLLAQCSDGSQHPFTISHGEWSTPVLPR